MLHIVERWLARYEAGEIDRREFLLSVAAVAGSTPVTAAPAATSAGAAYAAPFATTQVAGSGLVASGLHHVEIKTRDLDRARDFYAGLFGARPEVRSDRVILPLGSGEGRGYVSITTGPIERVDHFSVKVPGMHPRDPKATVARLVGRGYKARQSEARIFVTDPDGKEVEIQAPGTRPL